MAALPLKGVGEDTISLDPCDTRGLPQPHRRCWARDFVNTENLTGLDALIGRRFTFVTLPLKFENADGCTCRAAAIANGGMNTMGKLRFLLALWLAQAVHSGAEDHPPQRHGLPRLAGAEAVPGLSEVCGQARHDHGRHRHQRQDHRQQYAGGHSREARARRVLSEPGGLATSPPASPRRCCAAATSLGRVKDYDMAVLEVDERSGAADLSLCAARLYR